MGGGTGGLGGVWIGLPAWGECVYENIAGLISTRCCAAPPGGQHIQCMRGDLALKLIKEKQEGA